MRVFATNDMACGAVHIYVDLGENEDGNRLFMRPAHGEHPRESCIVAPGCEAPIYATFPRAAAIQLAAALGDPYWEEPITLETFSDFAELVERTFGTA